MIPKITDNLSHILQKNIAIKCNNKTLRQGTLLLLQVKDFYISFTLKIKGQAKKYELPYPFAISLEEDHMIFDYRIKALSKDRKDIRENLSKLNIDCSPNKLLDRKVIIELV